MLNRLDLRGRPEIGLADLPRPEMGGGEDPLPRVRSILGDVRSGGDRALLDLTETLDGYRPQSIRVAASEIDEAPGRVTAEELDALGVAAARIRAFHEDRSRGDHLFESDGVSVLSRLVPVRRAGCYVPGGRARYPSTLLMTAVVARCAGVEEVAVCVPADRETGRVADLTLAAAAIAGVDEVYAIGGAQAIAALAYGTESVDPVDVIVGPGNIWVATAKREVASEGLVGVPSAFTGPSEVVVMADRSCPAKWAAADVLVQAEHGPGGLAWCVTWDDTFAGEIESCISEIARSSPRRAEIESTLAQGGWMVLVDDAEQAVRVSDLIAPEHLQLMCEGAQRLSGSVRNAGAVFIGPMSPAALGDYLAGPSHVLPTFGSARFGSALGISDFCRNIHVVTANQDAIATLGPHVETLARAEGLDTHALALSLRLAEVEGRRRT